MVDKYALDISSPEQMFSLLGSIIILVAYYLMVSKPEKKMLYFSLSLVGGCALLFVATIYHNAGFIFLETAWISINGWGIWKAMKESKCK